MIVVVLGFWVAVVLSGALMTAWLFLDNHRTARAFDRPLPVARARRRRARVNPRTGAWS